VAHVGILLKSESKTDNYRRQTNGS